MLCHFSTASTKGSDLLIVLYNITYRNDDPLKSFLIFLVSWLYYPFIIRLNHFSHCVMYSACPKIPSLIYLYNSSNAHSRLLLDPQTFRTVSNLHLFSLSGWSLHPTVTWE